MNILLRHILTRKSQWFAATSLALLGAACFSGCTTFTPPGATLSDQKSTPPADQITWPAEYEPRDATFLVQNAITINAPPDVVWDILINAGEWTAWYPGATDVSVKDSGTGRLAAKSILAWNTMGLRFESRIREFTPPFRLSWESRKATITGYHAWLIIPTTAGCKVITEESQHGFLAVMQKLFIPQKLHRLHDVWLEGLKKKAEAQSAAK